MTIPSKESIEYGREKLTRIRDKYQKFYEVAMASGDFVAAQKWKRVVFVIVRDMLGHEDGGCVIVPFDQRWLDDDFRKMMEEGFEKVRASEGARRDPKPGQRRVPGNRGG